MKLSDQVATWMVEQQQGDHSSQTFRQLQQQVENLQVNLSSSVSHLFR